MIISDCKSISPISKKQEKPVGNRILDSSLEKENDRKGYLKITEQAKETAIELARKRSVSPSSQKKPTPQTSIMDLLLEQKRRSSLLRFDRANTSLHCRRYSNLSAGRPQSQLSTSSISSKRVADFLFAD
jgi:hypothetical protein